MGVISDHAQRFVAVAVALLVAFLLIIAAPLSEPQLALAPSIYDDQIIKLDQEAIESAYKKHIERLFENWVKDPAGQPGRALDGADNARRAFIDSMEGIDKRRQKK